MSNCYVGLMSGTSLDGIDAVVVDFSGEKPRLLHQYYESYEKPLREQLSALSNPGENEVERLGYWDSVLGQRFAAVTLKLLEKSGLSKEDINAIGSHGQTIRHRPTGTHPYTLQIGDPNIIVSKTGITTVADFRRMDIAYGGQGAPLVPGFHQVMFADEKQTRVILNLGGIANITLLRPQAAILGFDTGPSNCLLDDWAHYSLNQTHDKAGQFAKSGQVNKALLSCFLAEPYFGLPPPKSTGREYFNLAWIKQTLQASGLSSLSPQDVQATLVALTANSITQAIQHAAADAKLVIACGGGVHNVYLMNCLQAALRPIPLHTTAEFGFEPDWVEAGAFAWLAKQTLEGKPGNVPSVTGARKAAVLGGVWRG